MQEEHTDPPGARPGHEPVTHAAAAQTLPVAHPSTPAAAQETLPQAREGLGVARDF